MFRMIRDRVHKREAEVQDADRKLAEAASIRRQQEIKLQHEQESVIKKINNIRSNMTGHDYVTGAIDKSIRE